MTITDLRPTAMGATEKVGPDLPISDEELTALAMAADPDENLDPDAVPFGTESPFGELLPSWYMPSPVMSTRKRWHVVLAALVVAGFVVINLAGLCITYGHLVIA